MTKLHLPVFGKKVIKPLANQLLDENPKVRLKAASYLGESGYIEVIPILEQYLLVEEVPFIRMVVKEHILEKRFGRYKPE